ncbi:MAG: hypothetical protein HOY79_26205 [Streptomyces sp.]|nr:hypothetical protein [Streptomyces sp.]
MIKTSETEDRPGAASTPTAAVATGHVTRGGVHSGDLRYFLLPEPSDAVAVSDPSGAVITSAAAVADSRSESRARAVLTEYAFRDARLRFVRHRRPTQPGHGQAGPIQPARAGSRVLRRHSHGLPVVARRTWSVWSAGDHPTLLHRRPHDEG